MEAHPAKTELPIDVLQLKKAMGLIRALNHPLRQQILRLLHRNKQMTVTTIYGKLRMEQSHISQQLGILRKAGLVITKREERFKYYSVNYQRLQSIQAMAAQLVSGPE